MLFYRRGRCGIWGPLLMLAGALCIICNLPLSVWVIILGIIMIIFGGSMCRW